MTSFPVALLRANKHWVTKESNLDRFIYTIDLWLRVTGLGITRDNLNLTFFGFLRFLISAVPYFLTCLFGVVYNYYYLSEVVGEASDTLAMETAFPFISCLIAFIKAIWLFCSRREIYRVVTLAQELGPVTMPRLFWILTTMYVVMMYFSIPHRLIVPLIRGERVLPEDYSLIPGLEEWVKTPNYEITYAITAVGFYTIAPHVICFYSLYIGMAGHITAHYKKLGAQVENLLHKVRIERTQNVDSVQIQEQLTQIIHNHCKIVDVTDNVRMLFNTIIGFDFGLVTVGIGVLLFQISRSGFSYLADYIAYYVITLLVYCIPGERMCVASDSLPASVFSSGWEKFDPRERRSVLLMLRSAQNQQVLTAATFVPVNHATLMTILKTCFSIYAAFDAAKGNK